jgi:hypothetical protein
VVKQGKMRPEYQSARIWIMEFNLRTPRTHFRPFSHWSDQPAPIHSTLSTPFHLAAEVMVEATPEDLKGWALRLLYETNV